MQSWAKRDFFTYFALLVFLVIRIPFADLASLLNRVFKLPFTSALIERFESLQNQSVYFFNGYSLILISIVIVANRTNLERLNIDKGFILILLCGGLAYSWDPSWQLGLATALGSFSLFILSAMGWLKFGGAKPNSLRIILALALVFFLGVLFIGSPITLIKIHWIADWLLLFIPFVVVEEVMFRGMFWMFLKNLNFSEFETVILQALLFWLSHVHFANDPVFFWLIVPITSVLLGIIVWRFRSLTPSATAHLLINLFLGLVASRNL